MLCFVSFVQFLFHMHKGTHLRGRFRYQFFRIAKSDHQTTDARSLIYTIENLALFLYKDQGVNLRK
jgi:hypothetical protein